ncbi:DUF1992 domain-containing protein [Microbacterium rhizomatis]|uniref:DUF1992 domain-containing protein n=1 Tax=Microbacterium rhizomatis TaxID=1631477 RepID=A0A5J5IWH4_9MICO|nr:DUF1992 domain-containing protein [Microbacterium rhizomatis]KAA9105033.1 DUF1992 domain-containing protein [Microbacterium rhizomatis]
MADDPREAAARYRLDKEARDTGGEPEVEASAPPSRGFSELERAAYVETTIQQAIRRGEFDNLPGAGKPLIGLGASHDPDWWIRRKIETEGLTGLGPPALLLRTEHAQLDARLDDLRTEDEVRDYLEDFNARVIEARRQLLGGPPVVTPTVDVDERTGEWRARRDAARRTAPQATAPQQSGWWARMWRASREAPGSVDRGDAEPA